MEIIFKAVLTALVLCLIYYELVFVKVLWKSHVNVTATIDRIFRSATPGSEILETFDPQKIYQNGVEVGLVFGDVEDEDSTLKIEGIANSGNLQRGEPFEFRRERYRIVKHGSFSGLYMGSPGDPQRSNVLHDVECERLP